MQAVVSPGRADGAIAAPPSKSHFQRLCAAALLHPGSVKISNPGSSDDDGVALRIIQLLGADIVDQDNDSIWIETTRLHPRSAVINCGESGLSARLFTPIAALTDESIWMLGGGTLTNRTMEEFRALENLGVHIHHFTGRLPIHLQGPLQARSIRINGSASSQYLTGLLFALCATARDPVTIEVDDLKSKPYADLTLEVLNSFGWAVTHEGYRRFIITPAQHDLKEEVHATTEGDWSSAAAMLVAGCTAGRVAVRGLRRESRQADRAIVSVLEKTGADVRWDGETLVARKSVLQAFSYDCTDSPDLIPIIAVLAAACNGRSRIGGVHRLKNKESDRAAGTLNLLWAHGVAAEVVGDEFLVEGTVRLRAATNFSTDHDHRMLMAAAVAALRADGPCTILGPESVAKSYPNFFADFHRLGVQTALR